MDYLSGGKFSKCREIRYFLWERNGRIFAVGPRTCSGPSGSLGAPKKGAQDPAAKWAVIWTPAESPLFPPGPPWTILRSISPPFRRCLKPLTLFGPPVMIWPHETTSSAVDSSCNIFASRFFLIFFYLLLFHHRYYRFRLYHWDPINDRSIPEIARSEKKRNIYGNTMRQREDLKRIILQH